MVLALDQDTIRHTAGITLQVRQLCTGQGRNLIILIPKRFVTSMLLYSDGMFVLASVSKLQLQSCMFNA